MAKKPRKITVDTNILISSFVFPSGVIREVLNHAIRHEIEIFVSTDILEEYAGVLSGKFGWSKDDITGNLDVVRRMMTIIKAEKNIKAVHTDPTDDKVLECAVGSGSDTIVSGDRHLLDPGRFEGIRIIKAAGLLKEILK